MSEENEKKSSPDGEADLDAFEWDDALADWENELEDAAEAKSDPMPQTAQEPASRPLYRPPSPDDTFARRPPMTRAAAAPKRPVPNLPKFGEENDGKGVIESTRIASVPQELIQSLLAEAATNERPTRPPETEPGAPPPPVDLDLDGLIDGMEKDTAVPRAEAAPAKPALDPFAPPQEEEEQDKDVVASFPPRPLTPSEERALGRVPERPTVPGPEAKAKLAAVPRPPAPPPKSPTARAVPPPPPRGERPPIPSSAARPPKPGLPNVPRPPVPVPKPIGAPPKVQPPSGAKPIPKPPEDSSARIAQPSMEEPARPTLPEAVRPTSPGPEPPAPPPSEEVEKEETYPYGLAPVASKARRSHPSIPQEPDEKEETRPFGMAVPGDIGPPALPPLRLKPAAKAPAPEPDDIPPPPVLPLRTPPPPASDTASSPPRLPTPIAPEPEPAVIARERGQPVSPQDEIEGALPLPPLEDDEEVSIEADEDVAIDASEEDVSSTQEGPTEIVSDDGETATVSAEDDVVFEEGDEEEQDWEALEAEAAAAEAAEAAARDRGAIAARRSVRSRKPRAEVFPMVGDSPEAVRLRQRLLATLANTRDGGDKARLLVSAAELAEQLGESENARELYRAALDADPADVVALRALRRDALVRDAWDDLAELFAKEAQLALSPRERALALTGLAEVNLSRRSDPKSAERAAGRALELAPKSVGAALLLAEARFAQGKSDAAMDALAVAAGAWEDGEAKAALLVERARHCERKGDVEGALELYRSASDLDPEAIDTWFGVARTATRVDPRGSVAALMTIAERLTGALHDAALTRASRVATLAAEDPKSGVALLAEATSVLALQARAEAANASGDRQAELEALTAWASAAGGTDRALALVRMAEVLSEQGEPDRAEQALRDASLADGSLGTIGLVREVIARRTGDVARLVTALEAGGALGAAARVVTGENPLPRERQLLETAAGEGQALVAVDILTLDVAAAQNDGDALDAALRRQADRVPPEQRVGSLLALTERAIVRDNLEAAEALLGEARQITPGDPLVLRPLGRLAFRHEPTLTAALWLEEASVAMGARAAYAATEAGRILARRGGDAVSALRRALDAMPGYGPAASLLKPLAVEMGDPLTLGEVHEQLAERASDPTDAAGHLVRAALLRAEADPQGAGALLERARSLAPDDAILQSLLMRLAGTTSPKERAAMLATAAEKASPLLGRVFRLQAASAYEDAGDPGTAAAHYRSVALAHPDDAVVRIGLDRAEIASGEVARVAERRFAAVKEATEGERRVLALERLADLDLHERKDPTSAMLSLQSILEIAPGHLPSLRALQRYFAEQDRRDDEVPMLERMAESLLEGPDVTAHLRLAWRLRLADPETPGDAADEMLLRIAPRAELDFWLAPRLLAAARASGNAEAARTASLRMAELLPGDEERAVARLRAAELSRSHDPQAALALLREAVASSPNHPTAAEELAETCELAGEWRDAAEAWERMARATEVRTRAAERFYRAGRILQDHLHDLDRARAAYEEASERDVTHGDLFDRLCTILQEMGATDRLAQVFEQRLTVGGETNEMVDLYVKQAQLYVKLSDFANAKSALRAALALQPEHVDGLRMLANLCIEDEDWRGAAEVLIRIARIRKEREELRWVFFTLGDIYDRHMPDPRRAEAAFQRVLKLLPQDVPAMERLSVLYEREGQLDKAAETLFELARLDVDAESNRTHRLKLAEIFEKLGDARRAEQVLEEARKNAPTDLAALRALAEFYRRQNAGNALGMHLNRAVNDFRHALTADLGDAAAWPGLVELLSWRGDADAAGAAASAAQALGLVDVEMSKLVDAQGAAPGKGPAAAFDIIDDLLAPPELPAPTRMVFRLAGDALEKSLPFDVNAYRAERVGPRDTSIRPIAMECGRWFGIPDPQLFVTSAAPRVCVPVYSNPVTILIGSELVAITDEREKLFVLVRALKIAQAQLSVVVRAQPHEVVALIGGLVHSYDPHHQPRGADPTHVAEAARRVAKNVNRKVRDELGPLVFEMAGRPGYDPARLAMAASEWGNRTALLASGSAPAAFSSLAKLSGERELPSDPTARIAMLTRFPEASSLLKFAISDAHFEARRRAGRR